MEDPSISPIVVQGIRWNQAAATIGTKNLPIAFSTPFGGGGFNECLSVSGDRAANANSGCQMTTTQVKVPNDNGDGMIGALCFGV